MVFMVFDRSALFESLKSDSLFWGNKFEQPSYSASSTALGATNTVVGTAESIIVDALSGDHTGLTLQDKTSQQSYYHDQIPPFDVKLIAATERGHGAVMEILGAEILNCGSGISVDDITTDESCTWIGVNIIPWHNQTYADPKTGESISTSTTGDGRSVDTSGAGKSYSFS